MRSDERDRVNCDDPSLSARELTYCFLKVGNLDNGASERLGRYNAALWKQTAQTLFLLGPIRCRRYSFRGPSDLDDQFHERCHNWGIDLDFGAPIAAGTYRRIECIGAPRWRLAPADGGEFTEATS
jgi:hypothetical protein